MVRLLRKLGWQQGSIIVLSMLIFSCKNDVEIGVSDTTYFPLEVGQFQLYEVNETSYSISNSPIQKTYFLKEKISAKTDGFYKIERFKRQNTSQNWQIDSVWTAQLLPNKAMRNENNTTFVKLIFPIQSSVSWNKNEYNSKPNEPLIYQDFGKEVKIFDKTYPKTVTVVQKNDSSLISKNRNLEIYASNFGLIYKENTNLFYCQSSPDCIGKKQIDYGSQQIIRLIEKGKE